LFNRLSIPRSRVDEGSTVLGNRLSILRSGLDKGLAILRLGVLGVVWCREMRLGGFLQVSSRLTKVVLNERVAWLRLQWIYNRGVLAGM